MNPVIFIHWSDSFYLNTSVSCAEKAGNEVILLKDYVYERDFIKRFNGSLDILRWFVLLEYMQNFNISQCLYIDSDCLLFKKIKNEFSEYDMAVSKQHCGHVTFINNIDTLQEFCLFMENVELQPALIERARKNIPDGIFPDAISDMILLNNFITSVTHKFTIGDVSKIKGASVYDHNINVSDGYEMDGSVKRILFHGQTPYGIHDERLIKFNLLHLQGAGGKHRMEFYTRYE